MRRRLLVVVVLAAGWLSSMAAGPRPSEGPPPARLDVPVVLVPGWFDTARDLAALKIRLLGAGAAHVETLTFQEPTGSNREHAQEIDSLVSQVLRESGADQVDIVAHSMGGLATRWYLKTRPEAPVRRTVFIASPHHGTYTALVAWGEGRDEMMPDSEFLASLNSGAPLPEGIEAMTIRTPIDTHVLPGESATLPGVEDHTVCCPTHQGLLRSDDVFYLVIDFLERTGPPAEPR
ncbi:MAG: alpha/beta fold hydrolase [Longimicrobiales bacterium]